MKKIFVLFVLLLAVTSAASAQSLFPLLSTPIPEPGDLAPSYSGFANVEPDREEAYGEDGTLLTYEGVTEESYSAFGTYLEKFGFEATATNVNGRAVEMMLSNGKFTVGVIYNADDQILQTIYMDGSDYEKKDYFPEYKRVTFSDTINIDKWGTIQFREFALDTPKDLKFNLPTWITFNFYNRTDHSIEFSELYCPKYGRCEELNDIGEITLHYINSDNEYIYKMYSWGGEPYFYKFYNISSLGNHDLYVNWNTKEAEGIRNSTDGTLAITFDFKTGDKYVLILRENGVKIGEW